MQPCKESIFEVFKQVLLRDDLGSNSIIRTGTSYGVQKLQQCDKIIKTNSQKVLSGDMNRLEKLYGKSGLSVSSSILTLNMNRVKIKNVVAFSNFFSVNYLKFNILVC